MFSTFFSVTIPSFIYFFVFLSTWFQSRLLQICYMWERVNLNIIYFTWIAKQAFSLYTSRSMSASWRLNQYSRRLCGQIPKSGPIHHGTRTRDLWYERPMHHWERVNSIALTNEWSVVRLRWHMSTFNFIHYKHCFLYLVAICER